MRGSRLKWRRLGLSLIGGLAAPGLLSLGVSLAAAPETAPAPLPAAAAPAAAPGTLDLAACRQLAFEKHPPSPPPVPALPPPMLAPRRWNICIWPRSLRDLPIRRKQSQVGIEIAAAAIDQAEWDTRHDVTFTYLTAVYATEQLAVADQGIADLKSLRETRGRDHQRSDGWRKDIGQRNVDQIDVNRLVAQGRREEALEGVERALVALAKPSALAAIMTWQWRTSCRASIQPWTGIRSSNSPWPGVAK